MKIGNCKLKILHLWVIVSCILYLMPDFVFGAEPSPITFYEQINPKVLPECAKNAQGVMETGVKGLANCIVNVAKKLQPVAAILLVLVVTISGAYLIFSAANEKYVGLAKTALFWGVIGFVIVFSAELIRLLVFEIAR
jgi:hypothetical protein